MLPDDKFGSIFIIRKKQDEKINICFMEVCEKDGK